MYIKDGWIDRLHTYGEFSRVNQSQTVFTRAAQHAPSRLCSKTEVCSQSGPITETNRTSIILALTPGVRLIRTYFKRPAWHHVLHQKPCADDG